MITELFRNSCLVFGAAGILFIVIELKTRLDRSFLFFGISTFLLSLFTVFDSHLIPSYPSYRLLLLCMQHLIFIVCIPFFYTYLFMLSHTFTPVKVKIITILSLPFFLLFLSGVMFEERNSIISTSLVYEIIMIPSYCGIFIHSTVYIIKQLLVKKPAIEKLMLKYHLVAIAFLLIFGMLDLLSVSGIIPVFSPNYTTLGIFTFLAMTIGIFIYRLVDLVNENRLLITQIKAAYKELEQASALKELGKSSSIINHEIKNQMFIMYGNAELILDRCATTLNDFARAKLQSIIETSKRLTEFSKEILDLSRSQIIDKSKRINLRSVIQKSVEQRMAGKSTTVTLSPETGNFFICGDWNKLLHVFDNLFKNSVDAGATRIIVRLLENPSVHVVSVEDDGCGVDSSFIGTMFNAFETTKRESGGTGLGLSIVKSIIESHGGHINAYDIQSTDARRHGLIMNISLPCYEPDGNRTKAIQGQHIILVQEGITDLAGVIAIFNNVCCTPRHCKTLHDLDEINDAARKIIIASANTSSNPTKIARRFRSAYILVESARHGSISVFNAGNPEKYHSFTEEFILSLINGHGDSGTDFKQSC